MAQIVVSQTKGDIRLLVRGDDIGSFTAANHACIASYNQGIVRSLELMVPCAWFPEAVALLNENPAIDVSLHLEIKQSEITGQQKWQCFLVAIAVFISASNANTIL